MSRCRCIEMHINNKNEQIDRPTNQNQLMLNGEREKEIETIKLKGNKNAANSWTVTTVAREANNYWHGLVSQTKRALLSICVQMCLCVCVCKLHDYRVLIIPIDLDKVLLSHRKWTRNQMHTAIFVVVDHFCCAVRIFCSLSPRHFFRCVSLVCFGEIVNKTKIDRLITKCNLRLCGGFCSWLWKFVLIAQLCIMSGCLWFCGVRIAALQCSLKPATLFIVYILCVLSDRCIGFFSLLLLLIFNQTK